MKWEYQVIKLFSLAHIAINETEEDAIRANSKTLRMFGNEGWELVTIDSGIAYFKRPVRNIGAEMTQAIERNMGQG